MSSAIWNNWSLILDSAAELKKSTNKAAMITKNFYKFIFFWDLKRVHDWKTTIYASKIFPHFTLHLNQSIGFWS